MVLSVIIVFDRLHRVPGFICFFETCPSYKVPESPIEGPQPVPGLERNLYVPNLLDPVDSRRVTLMDKRV